MNNTEQLRQLMSLDANMNTYDIEERFEKIAKMLFESFAIQKGETVYLFKEIEFYFYNNNSSLKFEIKAKQFYAASQRVL